MNKLRFDEFSIEGMQHLYSYRVQLRKGEAKAFRRYDYTEDDLWEIHSVCDGCRRRNKRMKDVDPHGLGIRSEIFVMLYILNPRALYYKTPYGEDVIYYIKNILNITVANLSRYKSNLTFLYFNDKEFKKRVDEIIEKLKEKQNISNDEICKE